jgi:osmotically-inducible protein OsmY
MVPAALGLVLAIGSWAGADEPKDVAPAQQPKDTSKKVGEAVDDVVKGIKRGTRATTEAVSESVQRIRASVHDMGLHARVYGRLHWDKDLHKSQIEVEVKEATAILNGRVPSLQAKTKAVALARDTLGIERVEDRLTIEPAATVEPGSTAKPKR